MHGHQIAEISWHVAVKEEKKIYIPGIGEMSLFIKVCLG